ncbi:ATP-binding Cassette (ABC) Superfamily [Achlya hypogyna]|uniref:ATP-binding Cassette (ABC) Superfamily n=1 Tax=Achlya hypogyna TaxID=1202772 RepID=A0A1V9YNC5_ACHHY|nr:ATP-binding Cassette (ABC) Superfamily [Achlya hypogyna]
MPPTPTMELTDASFAWHTEPTLHRITLHVPTNVPSLTIVVGPVGSGKTSLIHALLGEMHMVSGQRTVGGRISFANQEAWIQHDTLRNNILFADALDTVKYERVIAACQLGPDLASLSHGDATEIGERGINLSGGQKARVSLARALYKDDADIYLLDDPLSALDVHVAGKVFADGIQGLLRNKTTVLVLNSHYHLLPLADRIVVMADGSIVGDGSFDDLKEAFPHLVSAHAAEDSCTSVASTAASTATVASTPPTAESSAPLTSAPPKGLVAQEDRADGAVSLKTYTTYFGSSGWNGSVVVATVFLSYFACQACVVGGDLYLSHWATTVSLASSLSAGGIYGSIMGAAIVLVCGRSLFALYIAQSCSLHFHERLFRKVLSLPVPTFFDVTPIGRVLNRFASDLDTLDSQIPFYGYLLLQFVFQILAVLVVCGVSTPYVLAVYPPTFFAFYKAQTYFNPASGALKRMESVTRSPLVTLVSEALHGLTTIRAFGMGPTFVRWNRHRLDTHMRFFSTFYMSRCWFQMRLDWLSATIIVAVAFVCIGLRSSLGLVAAGLSLTYAAQLSAFLSKAAMFYNNIDNMMTSVERLAHYDSLAGEDDAHSASSSSVSAGELDQWPSEAVITLTNVSMRYRPHLPLVLKDINLTIGAREKMGICGRTGSGKSSFMSALFRLVELDTGVIAIDGVDIARLAVAALRSKLTIIPQDPVLFSGPLRFNLDPSGAADDAALWTALKHVHLATYFKALGGLDFKVAEKGGNLSVGQRQLLCIARALLRQSKIVVLDEATANVDVESDRHIQEAIRSCFNNVTLLVIAHRLETILHCDKILVLDQGRVDEFDAPTTLLQRQGTFHGLMQQAGLH